MQKRLFILVVMLLTTVLGAVAQVTTSSMAGKVTVESGDEAVIGATIQAVHEPSGTRYTAVTNVNGLFTIQGMRTGGPYAVTVSYIGLETKTLKGITLQLGETYNLNVWLSENSNSLTEVVITGKASKFAAEKTGASTNISNEQMMSMPTVTRQITDITKLSPYSSGGTRFAGADPRYTNFTVDGANFNNHFGTTSDLPGGGAPISIDAIEEMQVVIAPYDVRQSNFIGGGINAITKSGTNEFKGTAYVYYRNQDMRGNRINGEDLGTRVDESRTTYGFTLGGPIIKNKLFFFANFEKELKPKEVVDYRAREDGESWSAGGVVSRPFKSEMEQVSNYLRDKFGYNTGSWTNFPGEDENRKLLIRLDWNITDNHHLALRYNNTKDIDWHVPNASSGNYVDGSRSGSTKGRVSDMSMAFANSLYYFHNDVESYSVDLNSRFGKNASNQLLFTYSKIDATRDTDSDIFPFIEIMSGFETGTYNVANGTPYDFGGYNVKQNQDAYMVAGYELFSYNNGVKNNTTNITDNFTYYLGKHKLMAGFRYEHEYVDNSYMREGTGYYRFRSLQEFLNGAAPETVSFTYGFDGRDKPTSAVRYDKIGIYLQDEFNVSDRFKFNFGIRAENTIFDNQDVERNTAIYALDFGGVHVDTGKWPNASWQFSPRLGFVWDVLGDKSLKVRGGSGVFTGSIPFVYLTNMPGDADLFKRTVAFGTGYKNGIVTSVDPRLEGLAGKFLGVKDLVEYFNLPTTNDNHTVSSSVTGVDENFKMPQVWKSSIAIDYQIPVSFPLSVTGEFIYNKSINAVYMDNINIKDDNIDALTHLNGADPRIMYSNADLYYPGKSAIILKNTSKGYGYSANLTVNAEPVKNLKLMASYTHMESKEISGLPGQNALSSWQGVVTVNGSNLTGLQRSSYVTPDQIKASLDYYIPYKIFGQQFGTHVNLFYNAYSPYSTSFLYTTDINGDGNPNDLIYIPANDNEILFKTEQDRVAFWNFVEQDDYLRTHKGQYAEAYGGRAPWLHRIDLHVAEDFQLRIGKTKHKIQISCDIINLGNMLNSHWGIPRSNSISNSGKILTLDHVDAQNRPVYTMQKNLTKTYDSVKAYSNCWSLQIGAKYFFN